MFIILGCTGLYWVEGWPVFQENAYVERVRAARTRSDSRDPLKAEVSGAPVFRTKQIMKLLRALCSSIREDICHRLHRSKRFTLLSSQF